MGEETIASYNVLRKLGSGGMGEVYLAHCTKLDREVAIKLLTADLAREERRRHRFITEARAASALTHPNVCVIYEVGETADRRPFIAMEYVTGKTLDKRPRHTPMQILETVRIGAQLADGLDAAFEKRIVHRDIKPANICINARGQVKILDFGLAKRMETEASGNSDASTLFETQEGQVLGTPSYMSPEQALGRQIDHRTDIFSLGIVLYELATGVNPFAGASFGDIVNKIVNLAPKPAAHTIPTTPPEFERITFKCLEKNPDRRYQSPRDLLIDLQALQRRLEADGAVYPTDSFHQDSLAPSDSPGSSESSVTPTPPEQTDIFISYAPIDDHPVSAERSGWISQFHRDLKVRVEQLSGDAVQIWQRPPGGGSEDADRRVLELIPGARALISVVSPPFVKSSHCRREVEVFWKTAESFLLSNAECKSRLFKVIKRPVPLSEMPPPLSDIFLRLTDFDFYDIDAQTGRLREYDNSFESQAKQRYLERIYDLAHEITDVLRIHDSQSRGGDSSVADRKTIFLAETSSDLREQRDRLRRELMERGHLVLPDKPLPLLGSELEKVILEYLERCDLALHLVGTVYGMVPEGARQSLIEIQTRLATETPAFQALDRLIWLPENSQVEDERQAHLIDSLRNNPPNQAGVEIIQGPYKTFKEVILDKLAPPPPRLEVQNQDPPPTGTEAPLQVYLICDPVDEQAVEPIEDFLFDQGFNVVLPDFEANEAEVNRIHLQNLQDCDAVLVYYGAARKAWVEIKLRDLVKIAGYGRKTPIALQAVYVGPPEDRRKERFRWQNTDIIRQGAEFTTATLQPFVADLRALMKPRQPPSQS
ncbi:MAG: protein kinase [Verrucomicrobia bacterium]|nr:protein kinase [Verrucomicrobiota bacterium]